MKYKLLTILTLALPLPIYLFLQATLFNIPIDVRIFSDSEVLIVEAYEDMYFISSTLETQYNGYTLIVDGMIGVLVDENDVIKTDNGLVQVKEGAIVDVKRELFQQQQSYKIPVVVFISLFGVMIVAIIVLKKMDLVKQYPRLSVMVSLSTGTIVLYVLNTVIGGILGVFMVATISWAVYCLEYMVHHGMITQKESQKTEAELLKLLRSKLK
jgi:hypothetical protein